MKLFGKLIGQNKVKNDTIAQITVKPGDVNSTIQTAAPIVGGAAVKLRGFKNILKSLLGMNKKQWAIIGILILVIASVLILSLFTVNRKDSANFVSGKRCDQSIIDRHNQAIKSIDNFANNVKAVALDVESKKGYATDITCVFIVYQHYAYVQDVERSRQLLDIMKRLEQEGHSIDTNIVGRRTIQEMEVYVKGLEHNRDIGDKANGSG